VRTHAALLLLAACASTPSEDPPFFDQPVAPAGLDGFSGISAVGPRVLVAGQPTPLGLANARDEGVEMVINLRTVGEMSFDERSIAHGLGMQYVGIPFSAGGQDDRPVQLFIGTLRQLRAQDGEESRVLVHCSDGDRAAAVWAMYEITEGKVNPELAVARARLAGLKSPELVAYIGEYARRTGAW
jgi:uncharacterized protein (TIGR01244 family)